VTPASAEEARRNLSKMTVEQIIFNIDSASGSDKSRKDVMVKVFFNQFNKFRGFNGSNIAVALYLEKDCRGKGNSTRLNGCLRKNLTWIGRLNMPIMSLGNCKMSWI
jgi:hypothetical protein